MLVLTPGNVDRMRWPSSLAETSVELDLMNCSAAAATIARTESGCEGFAMTESPPDLTCLIGYPEFDPHADRIEAGH